MAVITVSCSKVILLLLLTPGSSCKPIVDPDFYDGAYNLSYYLYMAGGEGNDGDDDALLLPDVDVVDVDLPPRALRLTQTESDVGEEGKEKKAATEVPIYHGENSWRNFFLLDKNQRKALEVRKIKELYITI